MNHTALPAVLWKRQTQTVAAFSLAGGLHGQLFLQQPLCLGCGPSVDPGSLARGCLWGGHACSRQPPHHFSHVFGQTRGMSTPSLGSCPVSCIRRPGHVSCRKCLLQARWQGYLLSKVGGLLEQTKAGSCSAMPQRLCTRPLCSSSTCGQQLMSNITPHLLQECTSLRA